MKELTVLKYVLEFTFFSGVYLAFLFPTYFVFDGSPPDVLRITLFAPSFFITRIFSKKIEDLSKEIFEIKEN